MASVLELNVLDLSMTLEDLSISMEELSVHIDNLDELEDIEVIASALTNSMEAELLGDDDDITLSLESTEWKDRDGLQRFNKHRLSAAIFDGMISLGHGDLSVENIDTLDEDEPSQYKSVKMVKSISSKVIPIIINGIEKGWSMNNLQRQKATEATDKVYDEIDAIRTMANEAAGKQLIDNDTVLHRETISLSMGYILPKSPLDIVTALTAISEATNYIHGTWLPQVKLVGEQIVKASKLHDSDSPAKTIERFTEVIAGLNFDAAIDGLKTTPTRDVRFKDKNVYSGRDLPGNYVLFIFRPDKSIESDATQLLKAKALRKRHIGLMHNDKGARKSNNSTTIKTFSLKEIETVLSECNRTLKMLEDINKEDIHTTLMFTADEIQTSFDENISPTTKRSNIPYHNASYHYASAYLKWSTRPASSLYTQSLVTIRAALTVCRRCLINYK